MNKKPVTKPTVTVCSCGSKPNHAKFHSAKGQSRPFFSKTEGRELLDTLISLKFIPKAHRVALLAAIGELTLPENSKKSGKGIGHVTGVLVILVTPEQNFGHGDHRGH